MKLTIKGYKLNVQGYEMHYRDNSNGHNKKVMIKNSEKRH